MTVTGPNDDIGPVFRAVFQTDADGAIILDDDIFYSLIVDNLYFRSF
jgi:hypothetical protein